ncbi:MAG: hypothetical protein ACJASL_003875 [Paraglaciecola sp.]|jgi:hypothetical protein
MSKFKVGDEIVRINNLRHDIKIGFKTIVEPHYYYMAPTGEFIKIIDKNWKLSKPKWTIYNNTLPWSDLSDKQKGKLLLAAHARVEIIGLGMLSIPKPVVFNCGIIAYQAVKPEPTTAELFFTDWHETDVHLVKEFSEYMIGKGLVKK